MLASLLNLLDRRYRVTLFILLTALAASAYFVTKLSISDAPERWTPKSTQQAWRIFAEHFHAGDTIGIGIHFRRRITEDDLPRLSRLRRELQDVPGIRQVYDSSLVAEKIERVPLMQLIDPIHAEASKYRLYSGVLWSEPQPDDPTRTLMTVCELEFRAGEDVTAPAILNARRRSVTKAVEGIVDRHRENSAWGSEVDFHVAGGIMMMREMEKRTLQVAYRFLPASVFIGLLALLIGYRSFRAVAVAMLGSAVAMLLVLGWLGAGGGTLGVVTMAAPTLMSIIGVASTIHFVSYSAENGTTGQPPDRRDLVRWVGVPCFGAAATTGVGFLMLRFNELAPIRDLGAQMFAGSLLAFLGVFVVSQWLPIGPARAGRWLTPPRLRHFTHGVTRRPLSLVGATAALVAGMGFLAWPRGKDEPIGLYVDADPFSFFAEDQPIRIALDHFSQKKFAVYQLDVILIPKKPGAPAAGLNPPDAQFEHNYAAAGRFVDRIAKRQDLGVIRVLSTQSFQRRYHQFLEEISEIGSREGLLPVLSQFGQFATSANILNHSFQAWNTDQKGVGALRVTFVAHDTDVGFAPLVDFVRANLPEDEFACHLVGSVAQNVDLAQGLGKGMIYGLGASLLVMALLCGGLFRSLRLATIAFLPNVFPVLVVFALMGMIKMPISSGSAMVATIALGIALNDTIHFLLHYRQRTREEGMPVEEAVLETVQSIGRPIVLTSVIHLAGFTIFLLTDFVPLYQFGLLSSIAMAAALLGDLVLLPNLLLVFDRLPSEKEPSFAESSSSSLATEPVG